MKNDEFKAWSSRNEGVGGSRPSYDPFNKSKKGHERNPTAPEYPCKDIPERHRYAEYRSLADKEKEKKKQEESKKDKDNKSRSSSKATRQLTRNIVQNIVPKVALVVVGGIVVVVSYNEIKAHEAQAAITTQTWAWSEDHSTAKVSFYNQNGIYIKELPAKVALDVTPATCTEDGIEVYTASVEDAGVTYSDVYTVDLPALGHDLDEGVESILDGHHAIDYECQRCHEHFILTTTQTWSWSEDHSTAKLTFYDHDGDFYKELPATVALTDTTATCTEDGFNIYTATVTDMGLNYSDTYDEPLAALGHDFDDGTESIVDGKHVIDYECKRCHEHFIITLQPEETEEQLFLNWYKEQGNRTILAEPIHFLAEQVIYPTVFTEGRAY